MEAFRTPAPDAATVAGDALAERPRGRASDVPATAVQREIWLGSALAADAGRAFTRGWQLELRGPLRIDALRSALDALLARHDALRLTFDRHDGEARVHEPMPMPWKLRDLRALGAARRDVLLERFGRAFADSFIALDEPPLLRCELLRMEDEYAVLMLLAHGAACDRRSLALLADELPLLYARALGEPVTLPDAGRFADIALAEAAGIDTSARRAAQLYWCAQYRQLPAALSLPTDRPRPQERGFAVGVVEHALEDRSFAALQRLTAQHDCTPRGVLLALYAAWLQRLGGSSDMVIAVPGSELPRWQDVNAERPEQQRIDPVPAQPVGPLARWLPVRIRIDSSAPFSRLLAAVVRQLEDADAHADCGIAELLGLIGIGRDPSRPPLAAVSFDHHAEFGSQAHALPPLRARFRPLPETADPFELGLDAVDAGDGVLLRCRHRADLFDELTIRHWLHAFEQLLLGVEAQPTAPLATLPIVADQTLAELRALQPAVVPLAECWPHRLLAAAAARHSTRPALHAIDARWRYDELHRRSANIASVLRARGLRAGGRVGLLIDRCADAVATILAVLRSGAAWVPLDPAYPQDRLRFMVEDAGLDLLVSRSDLLPAVDFGVPVLLFDRDAAAFADSAAAGAVDDGFEQALDPWQTVAYVIYTSGSTGRPKGVPVPHGALASLLQGMAGPLRIGPHDRQLAVVRLSFDVSVQDLLLPLSLGAELVLATREQAADPRVLVELVRAARVTAMEATPTTWRMLLEAGFVVPAGFRAMSAGEPLPMDVAERVIAQGGTFCNMYGPTETTVHCSWWDVQPRAGGMSIGRPIANYRMWVVDDHDQLCPLGVPGELCIAGDGVALGYLNRPELSAERFLPEPDALRDPASSVSRMYRSGDIGRWCADGLLECMGRQDGQIKLRGHRIETGEIESHLRALPTLHDAVVQLRSDTGEPQLVAYVVPISASTFDPRATRAALAGFLPEFMLPQRYVELAALPCTANGKIDHAALPAPPSEGDERSGEPLPPRTPLEHCIASIWRELLPTQRFGVRDDFFELGGHSLLAVRLFHAIAERTGINLPLATMYRAKTIEALAEAFAAAGAQATQPRSATAADDPWHPLVAIRPISAHTRERPLFLVHAVGGNVMNYRRLTEQLPSTLPVYGLQAIGLDGSCRPLPSIAAMAERYLQEIVTVQPDGPYRIGGGSMGGMVAFEIARRLRAAGAEIEHLLLFDTDLRPCRRGARRVRLPDGPGGVLSRLSSALRVRAQAWMDSVQVGIHRMLQRPLSHALRYRHVEAVNRAAYHAYRAGPYAGPLTLFVARDALHLTGDADRTLGWSTLPGVRLRVELLPGTHDTVVEQPALADALARLLVATDASNAAVALGSGR